MHVNAIGAAIDLRGAELNQMIQIFFEPTMRKVFFEAEHGREKPRGNLAIINSWFHSFFSLGSRFRISFNGMHRYWMILFLCLFS